MLEDSSPQDRNGQAILVIESEVLVRHAIADYLRDCGYTVIQAADSGEALTVLENSGVALEVVLCPVEIGGGLNGFQLKQWIQDNRPDVSIVLSGTIVGTAEAAAELCDDSPQVRRPYDPQALVDYIKRLFGKRENSI